MVGLQRIALRLGGGQRFFEVASLRQFLDEAAVPVQILLLFPGNAAAIILLPSRPVGSSCSSAVYLAMI